MTRVLAALLLAAVTLWAGGTLYALWGDNYREILPDHVFELNDADWQMLDGEGGVLDGRWAIFRPGRLGYARVGVGLPWPVSAGSVEQIEVEFSPEVPSRPMRLGWSHSATASPRGMVALERAAKTTAAVETRWLRPSSGEISLLVVETFGDANEPLVIEAVRLVAAKPDFVQFQRRLFGEWFALPPWTQRSANHTHASLQPVIVSPVLAVVLWTLLSVALASLFGRFSVRLMCLAAAIIAAVGWVVLDIRWQADLIGKANYTIRNFSDKSWPERRASDLDGELFEFIETLKGVVGRDQRRVFALGRDDYWRTRARYHGLPWSIRSTERPMRNRWTRHLHSGDIVLLLDAPHVEVFSRDFEGDPNDNFSKDFDLSAIAGRGTLLSEASGEATLMLEPGQSELVRAGNFTLPAAGFYRVTARLKGEGAGASARIVIRWRDNEGERVTAVDRQFSVVSDRFEAYSSAFVLPDLRDVEIFVVDGSGERLRAEAVRVDRIQEDGLAWLRSGERGPYLVVRPLLANRLHEAYEVL